MTLFGVQTQRTTANAALFSSVPFGNVPANGFYGLNNTFGTTGLVNGKDFSCAVEIDPTQFPNKTDMTWAFPDSGGSGFAFAYPEIIYGRGETGGNPYNVPYPTQKISQLTTLVAHYDLTIGGNSNSYDILLDTYVNSASDGSGAVLEISYYPSANFISGSITNTSVHTFSFGECLVGLVGPEIVCYPTSGGGTVRRFPLATGGMPFNILELLNYVISISLGGLTSAYYLMGMQLGSEIQVPAAWNSGPYNGTLRINQLSYDWV